MPAPPLANSLEGTNGTAISVANSGPPSGDAFSAVTGTLAKYNTTQVAHGASAMGITQGAAGAAADVDWTGLGSLTGDVFIRYCLWLPANPAITIILGDVRSAAAGQSTNFRISTGGLIQMANAANTNIAAVQSAGAIATAQWIRLEYRVKSSTTVGEVEWRYYSSLDSTSITETKVATAQALAANTDQTRFGHTNPGATSVSTTTYWDDMAVSTADWLGPVAPRNLVMAPMTH